MAILVGYGIKSPVVYAVVNVAIWTGAFIFIAAVLGSDLLGAVIPVLFGGLWLGFFALYLRTTADD